MTQASGEQISIQNDADRAVEVIRHVGAWMRDSGLTNYSEWWDPDNVSTEMLSQYAKPDELFVLTVDGQPAAAAILQPEQSLQDWSAIDGDNEPPRAMYIHYLAVERNFAGRGLASSFMDKAMELAQEHEATVLRLDTNADEPKLCALYEGLGFKRVGTVQEDHHSTALYEKKVVPLEIERKFLVERLPPDLDLSQYENEKISQGYLVNAKNGAVRLRRKGDKFFLTFKGTPSQHSAARVELETEISEQQFNTLWPGITSTPIEKKRYRIPYAEHTIELDIFAGANAGKMLAEVEFNTTAAANSFVAPDWFSTDVTKDIRFGNASIAENGFPE